MTKAFYNVVYNRRNNLLKDGTALIQIEAYCNGRKKYFTTKIYITPDQWDNKHSKIKNHPNAIKLNKQISDIVAKMEGYELDRYNSGKTFSLDSLTELMNGRITNSFIDFMDMEIKECNLSKATKVGFISTLTTLKEFKKELLFDSIDYTFLTAFKRYLQGKGLSVNTINKYFRHIKRFVNIAINKELFDLNRYPFRNFKIELEETEREYLTPEELTQIENVVLPPDKQHLQKTLDMFIFSCYTGLRFSDVSALNKDMIIVDGGVTKIVLRMQKTNQPITLPLSKMFNGKGIEILNRYIEPDRKYIFDDITNQYANRCLKEIATLAKINKLVTFHVARHTTATFLLYKGMQITTVQKVLGHKKLQTTQIYAKVMDMTLTRELEAIDFSS
ncbi:MAG: site-specific integrase [Rikenellaceae bacterium]